MGRECTSSPVSHNDTDSIASGLHPILTLINLNKLLKAFQIQPYCGLGLQCKNVGGCGGVGLSSVHNYSLWYS